MADRQTYEGSEIFHSHDDTLEGSHIRRKTDGENQQSFQRASFVFGIKERETMIECDQEEPAVNNSADGYNANLHEGDSFLKPSALNNFSTIATANIV